MKLKNKDTVFKIAIFCTICYTPIVLVGIGFFPDSFLNAYNINKIYQNCLAGSDTCIYGAMIYVHLLSLLYVVYRTMKWAVIRGLSCKK